MTDIFFMQKALVQAQMAFEENEIPVGAVLVANGEIIAKSHNQVEKWHDVTAHAEILAITSASQALQSKYLPDCTLYVTLEPCVMCAGSIFWSKIGRLVYGASDSKKGFSLQNPSIIHPKTEVVSGILAEECEILIKQFFQKIR